MVFVARFISPGGTTRPWAVVSSLAIFGACSRGTHEPAPRAREALERGLEFDARNQLDLAAEAFREAIALDPAFAEAHMQLGRTLELMSYVRVGRGGEAPANVAHVTLGREEPLLDESIAHLERAVALDPRNAEPAYLAGRVLYLRGRDADAIAMLETAVALDPAHGEAYKRLGTVLLDNGEPAAALASLRVAQSLLPEDGSIPFHIGNILQEADPEGARSAYEQAIATDRTIPWAHNGLATVLARLRDAEGAARARHDFEIWEKLELQLQAAEARARNRPDEVAAQLDAGELHFAVGRKKAALGYFRQAHALAPDEPLAHLYLGILLAGSDPAEGRRHLEECLRFVPDAAQPKVELLRLGAATNDAALVAAMLERIAPEVHAWDAEERLGLADFLLESGRVEAAEQHYAAVRSLEPDNAAAAQGLQRARAGKRP